MRTHFIVAAVLLLVVASCGDDGATDTTSAPPTTTAITTTTTAASTTTLAPVETGIPPDWLRYTHPAEGWSISVPPQGWTIDDSRLATGGALVISHLDGNVHIAVAVEAFSGSGSEEYADSVVLDLGTGTKTLLERGDLPQPFVITAGSMIIGDGETAPGIFGFYYDPDSDTGWGYTMAAGGVDFNDDLSTEVMGIMISLEPAIGGMTPTDELIAYTAIEGNTANIWVISPDGTGATKLTDFENAVGPRWSPDRSMISFFTADGGEEYVWLMDADGGNQRQVTDFSSAVIDWHPDGTGLVFNCDAFGEPQDVPDICTMDEEGTVNQIIDFDETYEYDGHYSPDGAFIWFTSGAAGNPDIYLLEVATGEITPQLDTAESEEQARPSPDGSQLLFTLKLASDDQLDIWLWDIGEDLFYRLTDDPAADDMPEWSPDGSQIVFASERGGNFDLWLMDADGSNQRQLTMTPDIAEIVPSW